MFPIGILTKQIEDYFSPSQIAPPAPSDYFQCKKLSSFFTETSEQICIELLLIQKRVFLPQVFVCIAPSAQAIPGISQNALVAQFTKTIADTEFFLSNLKPKNGMQNILLASLLQEKGDEMLFGGFELLLNKKGLSISQLFVRTPPFQICMQTTSL